MAQEGPAMLSFDAGLPVVLSVTQVNNKARLLLERQFCNVAVQGELSSVRVDGAGHTWFCLKDPGGVLNGVIFRGNARALRVAPKDGMQVLARGRLTIYGATGRYQLVAQSLEPQGAGALQAAFEALKAQLQQEGLFALERKRPLPLLPRRVAVVTSPQGAVIRDIVHVAQRRNPRAQILMVPCRVQGDDCAKSVAHALQTLADCHQALGIDVIIVARGGGSLTDLWGFNSEIVARAIARSPIPVVSAVGHETDFTMGDFVADVRAPTPSAAAETVFPLRRELLTRLHNLEGRAAQAFNRKLQAHRLRLRALLAELGDGKRPIMVQAQRLSHLRNTMHQRVQGMLNARRHRMAQARHHLDMRHPRVRLEGLKRRLQAASHRLQVCRAGVLPKHRLRLGVAAQRMNDLSPLAVLGRGYAIVLTPQGRAVRRRSEAPIGSHVTIKVHDGTLKARIEGKECTPP